MPGQQLIDTRNRGEYLAVAALSNIASVTHVPREEDYGVDLYCTIVTQHEEVLRAGRPFGVQVKPSSKRNVEYGGLDKHGNWKNYEINWLFNQEQPLLLVIADTKSSRIKLYSTLRMWYLMYQIGHPNAIGKIVLSPDKPLPKKLKTLSNQWRYKEEKLKMTKDGTTAGNGFSYEVPLGKPIVDLSTKQYNQDELNNLVHILGMWIDIEYTNLTFKRMGVPYVLEWISWETNQAPSQPLTYQFWNPAPGQNITGLLLSITPAIQSLLLHLEAQERLEEARIIIPLARWLKENGTLDGIGLAVLGRLEQALPGLQITTVNQ